MVGQKCRRRFFKDLSLTFYSKSVLAVSLPKAHIFTCHAAIASKSVRLGTFLSGTKYWLLARCKFVISASALQCSYLIAKEITINFVKYRPSDSEN
jgi:hypothetical protein